MTWEQIVTPEYVRKYSDDFSVNVTKNKDGLIEFAIKHNVARPAYHIAHLAVYHQGKLIATSNTPMFGKKQDNEFEFALSSEDITGSKFDLSDCALDSTGEVPVPGTIIYQFKLLDFVPNKLLKDASP